MPKDAEGIYEPGQTLTEEEKGEILKDVARQKAEQKAVADKVKNAKTSAELGITRKAPAAGSTSKSAAASKPAGIEGMLTAAKKPAAAAAKGAAAKGVGAKSAAGAKPSAGAKPAKPTGSKLAAAKKGGKPAGIEGMITAAKKPVLSPEEQAAAEAAEAEAAAAAAAEAHARRLEADAAADAERERRWAESEVQRQEIQNQIVEEERRVRKREEERRKKLAAEKKKQARHTALHPFVHHPLLIPLTRLVTTPYISSTPLQALLLEAAFDNEQEDVQQMITAWVEECFSPLIGAKLDCLDANEHTPLSEAACGGALEVCTLLLKHGANVNTQNHQGRTPLWRAAFMDKQECVKLLLEAGADPRITSSDQQTPLQAADLPRPTYQSRWNTTHYTTSYTVTLTRDRPPWLAFPHPCTSPVHLTRAGGAQRRCQGDPLGLGRRADGGAPRPEPGPAGGAVGPCPARPGRHAHRRAGLQPADPDEATERRPRLDHARL